MTNGEEARLTAILCELRDRASSAVMCLQHVHYTSPKPENVERYKRTYADVGVWIREATSAHERLALTVAALPELGSTVGR